MGRTIGLTAVALVVIALCVVAASWQWQSTQDSIALDEASLAAPTTIDQFVTDQPRLAVDAIGRQIELEGTVLPDSRAVVRERLSADGEPGFYIVYGLATSAGTIPVHLGWVAQERDGRIQPGTELSVSGRLQPFENFYPLAPTDQQTLITITGDGLAQQWDDATPALPGFVTATAIIPANGDISLVEPVIGTTPPAGLPLRNILYGLQWLIFAGFAAFIWWRFLHNPRTVDVTDESNTTDVAETERQGNVVA